MNWSILYIKYKADLPVANVDGRENVSLASWVFGRPPDRYADEFVWLFLEIQGKDADVSVMLYCCQFNSSYYTDYLR
jgi:hypothetical protein